MTESVTYYTDIDTIGITLVLILMPIFGIVLHSIHISISDTLTTVDE